MQKLPNKSDGTMPGVKTTGEETAGGRRVRNEEIPNN
jgi:hypothetical protein